MPFLGIKDCKNKNTGQNGQIGHIENASPYWAYTDIHEIDNRPLIQDPVN